MTVKLSFTIIQAWAKGQWESAVSYYLGRDLPATPAMELGRLKDEIWSNFVKKEKKLHPELGGGPLKNPLVQPKYERLIPLSSDIRILFRGKPDLLDLPTIYDFKCGLTGPAQYVDGWQMDAYKLLVPKAEEGIFNCFNPYTEETEVGVKYLSEKNSDYALEMIITHGSELIEYLQSQKLLKDYAIA